jgi:hypothetical protein
MPETLVHVNGPGSFAMSFASSFQKFVGTISGQKAVASRAGDRREADRKDVKMHGYVTFHKRPAFPPVACTIKNYSSGGACIELTAKFADMWLFDDEFRLFIEQKDQERMCRVAWTKESVFGLKFEGPKLDRSRVYPPRR